MALNALILSDIHGTPKALDLAKNHISSLNIDVTVICGDITHFGNKEWAANFINNIPNKVIGVTGNCDPLGVDEAYADAQGMNLHMKNFDLKGVKFVGLNGINHTEEELNRFSEVSKGAHVFVLHSPPFGLNDRTRRGTRIGDEKLNPIINENQPLLVLSGHVHESPGIVSENGITYINPGPASKGYASFVKLNKDEIIEAMVL